MRTRHVLAPALVAVLALGACTSGADPREEETGGNEPTGAAQTTAPGEVVGEAQGPTGAGYLCRYVSPSNMRTAAGVEEIGEPLQVVTVDDEKEWSCVARDGETEHLRLSFEVGEEARDAQREAFRAHEEVQAGPDYLGEAYLTPRAAVGLTLCKDVLNDPNQYIPMTMSAEVVSEGDEDVSGELRSILTVMASQLDQAMGCSPRMALEEAEPLD